MPHKFMLCTGKLLDLGSVLTTNIVVERTAHHISSVCPFSVAFFPHHHFIQATVFPEEASPVTCVPQPSW